MSTGTEDFEKLRKLLKLKRYEQPPPGYFNNFSNLVISRIEREGNAQGASVPWFGSIFRVLESSPVFSGLFGAAVCALVIYGISAAKSPSKIQAEPLAVASSMDNNLSGMGLNASAHSGNFSSTDPMLGDSVFNSPFAANNTTPGAQAVSFTPNSQ